MSTTMIQIRNVPDKTHRQVKARAAMERMSMSDFILRELERVIQRPSREELLERISRLPQTELQPSAADVIGAERQSR